MKIKTHPYYLYMYIRNHSRYFVMYCVPYHVLSVMIGQCLVIHKFESGPGVGIFLLSYIYSGNLFL